MRDGAVAFLVRGMSWLEDEDGLREDEETGGVEEGVGGEEDARGKQDGGPDGGCEEDYAGLGDDCCAWVLLEGMFDEGEGEGATDD